MNTSDLIITILYFSSALASLVFAIRYMRTKWFKTAEGQTVMALHLIMVGFAVSAVLRLVFGPYYPGRTVIAIVLFTALVTTMWRFTWLLEMAQRRVRARARERVTEGQP